jgi:hypothetical protein
MRAGLLFQIKKPKVAPAVTVASAAIKNWSPLKASIASAIDETATVPAAPPSKLSKKLIELHIPTTQTIVMNVSKISDPVGLPTFSVTISITAVNIPAIVWATKRGSGGKFFMSSQSPISPNINAGASTEVASQKVSTVKFETNDVE